MNSPAADGQVGVKQKISLCVVGAGAIGISLATEFIGQNEFTITIVESGDTDHCSEGDDRDQVINTGDVDSGLCGSRVRGVGGSTQTWGGQALPFCSIDFEQREWMPDSGWPFSEQALAPYYARVEQLFSVEGVEFKQNIWLEAANSDLVELVREAAVSGLDLGFSKISQNPNFAKAHRHLFAANNINLMVNSTVVELLENEDGSKINSIVVHNPQVGLSHLHADIFILCAGGIENPRILLASKGKAGTGVGNHHDMAGRYYQDHIGFYGARLVPKSFSKFKALFATRSRGPVKLLPKISLSPASQIETQSLNITGNLEIQTDQDSPLNLMRSLYNSFSHRQFNHNDVKSILKLIRSPAQLISAAYILLIKKQVYIPRNAEYFLVANIESAPLPESRITVTDELDSIGMPRPAINWMLNSVSRTTALSYFTRLKELLEAQEVAEVEIKEQLYQDTDEWKQHCYGLYHHMGATRMSAQAEQGVVDENCKVHGIDNLYIAGTSVLPTGGASNPTFTAIALALKLADHLKRKVAPQSNSK